MLVSELQCRGFIPIIIGMIVMFWGLTLICEEYCVPAISVVCQRNKISDDFAGSTAIGAGLSLPILFASYIGLFSLNASIGLGTVVGGNLLNQTINVAFSVFVAPNRRLKLCRVVLTREMISYGISNLITLWVVEQDLLRSFIRIFNPDELSKCLSVSWQNSLILVSCYLGYCFMEGYFLTIVRVFLRYRRSGTIYGPEFLPKSSKLANASENPRRSPSLQPLSNGIAPEENSQPKSDEGKSDVDHHVPEDAMDVDQMDVDTVMDEELVEGSMKLEQGQFAQNTVNLFDFVLLETNTSAFCRILHDEIWTVRFCTIHAEGFLSYRLRKEQLREGRHVRFVDLSRDKGVKILNPELFEFSISARHPYRRTFTFRAKDKAAFHDITTRLIELSREYESTSLEEKRVRALDAM
jgi:Sodium/calcium exchanger protein